jgi:hypothetical protein
MFVRISKDVSRREHCTRRSFLHVSAANTDRRKEMALHRQNAEFDHDIATVLSEHACMPLDDEIERLSSLLATCVRRSRLQEAAA